MSIRRLAMMATLGLIATTVTLQACVNNTPDKSGQTPNPTSSVSPIASTIPTPVATIDELGLKKIVDIAIPLPGEITFTCKGELQGDAEICEVTKNQTKKTGYIASLKGEISKWNADQVMSYFTLTHKGEPSILTVPKFK
jgi:hypothetical protein